MLGLTIGIMVTALTIASMVLNDQILTFISAGFWLIFSLYMRAESTATWDLYYGLFFLAIAMVIVMAIKGGTVYRTKKGKADDPSTEEMLDIDEEEIATNNQNKNLRTNIQKLRHVPAKARAKKRDQKTFNKISRGE